MGDGALVDGASGSDASSGFGNGSFDSVGNAPAGYGSLPPGETGPEVLVPASGGTVAPPPSTPEVALGSGEASVAARQARSPPGAAGGHGTGHRARHHRRRLAGPAADRRGRRRVASRCRARGGRGPARPQPAQPRGGRCGHRDRARPGVGAEPRAAPVGWGRRGGGGLAHSAVELTAHRSTIGGAVRNRCAGRRCRGRPAGTGSGTAAAPGGGAGAATNAAGALPGDPGRDRTPSRATVPVAVRVRPGRPPPGREAARPPRPARAHPGPSPGAATVPAGSCRTRTAPTRRPACTSAATTAAPPARA